jgi:hypothetical protein
VTTLGAPKRGAKPDELALWARVAAGERPRDAGRDLGIPSGRVEYLCEKWASAGIYEYGVSADMGWPIGRAIDWSKPVAIPLPPWLAP